MFGVSFSDAVSSEFSLFLCLPPVAEVKSVACVGFMVEGTGACALMAGAGSCLSGGQYCVRWCVLGCLST